VFWASLLGIPKSLGIGLIRGYPKLSLEASTLGAIKRIPHLVPINVLIDVYNSLLQPYFDYCSVVWRNCGVDLSEKLQKLQNRAARILMYASNEDDIDKLFQAIGWPKLSHQRLVATSVTMFKTLNELTPEYLQSRIVSRNDIISCRQRNSENKLALPQPLHQLFKEMFFLQGCYVVEQPSHELRSTVSLGKCKRKVRRYSFK